MFVIIYILNFVAFIVYFFVDYLFRDYFATFKI